MAVFKIVHITKYEYSWPIKESINEIRLFPHHFDNQDVLQFQLLVSNSPNVEISRDYYGNRVGNFNTLDSHKEMILESRMLVRINHSLKIPEIDTTTIADLSKEIQKSIMLQRLCYPEAIEKQNQIEEILKNIIEPEKSIIAIAQECNHHTKQQNKT